MVNEVTLIGNLGQDPEVKHLESGAVVANFSLATSSNKKNKAGEWEKNTEWHNIVLWSFAAQTAEKHLKKGMLVYINGKLATRKWQDKNGNNQYRTEVIGNTLKIMEKLDRNESEALSKPKILKPENNRNFDHQADGMSGLPF